MTRSISSLSLGQPPNISTFCVIPQEPCTSSKERSSNLVQGNRPSWRCPISFLLEEGEGRCFRHCFLSCSPLWRLSGSVSPKNKPLVFRQRREHSCSLHEVGAGLGGSNCFLQTFNHPHWSAHEASLTICLQSWPLQWVKLFLTAVWTSTWISWSSTFL